MPEIYKNTPENQKKFEEFWKETPSAKISTIASEEVMSCVDMVRKTIYSIDTWEKEGNIKHLSLDLVRELFMDCLRGKEI